MNPAIKSLIKKSLPPLIMERLKKRTIHWRGDYPNWKSAQQECTGYDRDSILQKIDQATSKVVSGAQAYERDSVTFDKIEYSWPLLTGLLLSHALQKKLHVMDIGGSLGSTYYQNRNFLQSLEHTWNIVEQKKYVELGQKKYQTQHLRFFNSVDDCLAQNAINTVVVSSTLQYLENPMQFLEELVAKKISILILDRVSIIQASKNRLTKQTVPKEIYSASYPCWFFCENELFSILQQRYDLVEKFESFVPNETFIDGTVASRDYGYIFRLKA